ncbi:MAG: ATP-binding cassette domain-containing protein, partial [Gemmatimonadota bacterium]|nr:ATP-binding cassette domain-containing protein [Gemmatimonadota bacterium]
AQRLLGQVGLAPKAGAWVHELSGGEQQRVAIARALASEPLLLLADEPTGNLDDRATRGIMDLFWEINAVGMAVLMATHDLELMNRHPNARVLELDQGRLVYDSGDEKAAASGEQRSPRPASGMSPVLGGEPDVDPEREPAREPELDRGSDLALEPKLGREPEPAQETGN